jgi:signal transduction histidine kinase
MKKLFAFFAGLLLAASTTFASERGTADEAQAMVRKAVALVKSAGKDKAFAEFNKLEQGGAFKDRDLYVMVYDKNGVNLAHGANHKLHGKNLIELKDADGKLIVKGLVDTAFAGSGKGWVEYNWPNPVTKAVEAKRTYVERVDDILIGVGVYK